MIALVNSTEIQLKQPLQAAQKATLDATPADGSNGSRAIASGRLAALALEMEHEAVARTVWGEVPVVPNMPSLADLYLGYHANPAAFAQFSPSAINPVTGKLNFPAGGSTFSNAAGSYAYALDVMARGPVALAGGENQSVAYWASAAVAAAGFPDKAQYMNQIIASGIPVASQQTVKGM